MARSIASLMLLSVFALLNGVTLAGPLERRDTTTSTIIPTTIPTTTPTATPTPSPKLSLLYYIWGATDQTSAAQASYVNAKQTSLKINTANPEKYGFHDPHYGYRKSIVALFEARGELYTIATNDFGYNNTVEVTYSNPYGTDDVYASGISNVNNVTRSIKKPAGATFEILSVVWGNAEIYNASTWQSLYHSASIGKPFRWSTDLFGPDTITMYTNNLGDSGTVFYRAPDGSVQYLAGYQNTQSSFPSDLQFK